MKLLALLFFLTPQLTYAKVVDRILVIVNSEILTESDVTEYHHKLKSGGLIDNALLTLRDPQKLLKNRTYLLDHLIDEKLLDVEIKRQNLQATIEQVEKEIRNVTRSANNGRGITRKQLKQTLKQKNIKFSDYQDYIKKTIERRSLIQKEIQSQVKVTDDDITTFYISKFGNKNTQLFEYHLAHILFLNANGGAKEALAKATVAHNKLSTAPFDEVAEQHSEDPNFTAGGFMGAVKDGDMRPEVEKEIHNIKTGSYTKIIKTSFGFQIVKLIKKSLVENPELSKVKRNIRGQLMAQAISHQLKMWIENKRAQAFIRKNGK